MSKSNLRKLLQTPPPKIEDILSEKKDRVTNETVVDNTTAESSESNTPTDTSVIKGNARRSSLMTPTPIASKRKGKHSSSVKQPAMKKIKVVQNVNQPVKNIMDQKTRTSSHAQPLIPATPVNTSPAKAVPAKPVVAEAKPTMKRKKDFDPVPDRTTTKKLKPSSFKVPKNPGLITVIPKKSISLVSFGMAGDYFRRLAKKQKRNRPVINTQGSPDTQTLPITPTSPKAQQLLHIPKPTVVRSDTSRPTNSPLMVTRKDKHSSTNSSLTKNAINVLPPAPPPKGPTDSPLMVTRNDRHSSTSPSLTKNAINVLPPVPPPKGPTNSQRIDTQLIAPQQDVTGKDMTRPPLNLVPYNPLPLVAKQQIPIRYVPPRPDQPPRTSLVIIPTVAKVPLKDPRLKSLPSPNQSPPPEMDNLLILEQQRHASSTIKLDKSPTSPLSQNSLPRVFDQSHLTGSSIRSSMTVISEQQQYILPAMNMDPSLVLPPIDKSRSGVFYQGHSTRDQLPPINSIILGLYKKSQLGPDTVAQIENISPLSPSALSRQQKKSKARRKMEARLRKAQLKKHAMEAARRLNAEFDLNTLVRQHEIASGNLSPTLRTKNKVETPSTQQQSTSGK